MASIQELESRVPRQKYTVHLIEHVINCSHSLVLVSFYQKQFGCNFIMNLLFQKLLKRVQNINIFDRKELQCSPKPLIIFPHSKLLVKYSMSILEV